MGLAEFFAHGVGSSQAVVAGEARDMMMRKDAVSKLEVLHLFAGFYHDSSGLVAENQWDSPFQVPLHEVGSADSTSLHLHKDLVLFDLWYGYVFDSYVVEAVVHGGLHFRSMMF